MLLCDPKLHGTRLRWLYDRSIFDSDVYYSLEAIESRLKADLKRIVENEEIRTIINVLGTGTRDALLIAPSPTRLMV